MSYNYLDKTGLASVWAKIKAALATKANSADLADIATSGSYDDLNDIPEILTTNDDVITEDQVPYLFRKSPDSDRVVEEIVGGTVGWNQLVVNGNFADGTTGWTSSDGSISASDGILSFTSSTRYGSFRQGFNWQENHKYLLVMMVKGTSATTNVGIYNGSGVNFANLSITTSWTAYASIANHNKTSASKYLNIQDNRASSWDTLQFKNIALTDLTTYFGNSTIADYVYNLETTTAGAGIEWLKKYNPKLFEYNEYCEPTLRSVEGLVSKKTVGFNQWDEEWEAYSTTGIQSKNAIPVTEGETYYIEMPSGYASINNVDKDRNYISYIGNKRNTTFTIPTGCKYIQIICASYGTTYNHDICINLSDPTRNGQYEPYESHTYSLDSEVVLRGVLKLDSSNNLYYDGDVYPADGNGSRRYGIVDLGTLNWNKQEGSSTQNDRFMAVLSDASKDTLSFPICAKYVTNIDPVYGRGKDKTIIISSGNIYVEDTAYSSSSDFKTAMNGVMLVYPLETPTTFTAQPYHNPQIVGDIEEWVTTGIVPVGHSTKYHTSYYTTNDYIKEKGYLTEKDILGKVNTSDLATVATSGSYNDLDDKPTIPTNEIFVGSTTPSGYTLYIDPEGSLSNGEGVSF